MASIINVFKSLSLDELNFAIALLALLLSAYSIYYTQKCNRRRIKIHADVLYFEEPDPPIHWFTIHNVSAVSVTITDIQFFSPNGSALHPLTSYEPQQTYSEAGPFQHVLSDIIPDYKYSEPLLDEVVLYPHTSEEFGYYFDSPYTSMKIDITAQERIHHFSRHQSFLVHFPNIEN